MFTAVLVECRYPGMVVFGFRGILFGGGPHAWLIGGERQRGLVVSQMVLDRFVGCGSAVELAWLGLAAFVRGSFFL